MKEFIICSSQLVFAGSADSQVFLINEGTTQNYLISFSGFLNAVDDDILNLRISETIIYTGPNVQNIIETTMKRSEQDKITEHHSFRRFEMTLELKQKVVDWLFQSEHLETMN